MSAAAPARRRPAAAWTPPLDADGLAGLLARLHTWEPFDGGPLLDDVATALDEVPPPAPFDDLTGRLRAHLARLVDIAIASEVADADDLARALLERAFAFRAETLPGDHRAAVVHLRRLAWTAHELLQRLVDTRCLKEAA